MNDGSSVRTLLLVGVLLLFGIPLVLSVFSTLWFGTGSTMTGGGMMGGGMMGFGAPMFGGWLLFVALALGLGYVLLSDGNGSTGTQSRTTDATERSRASERGELDEDDALATLRARYARGELDDEEFERKVEALLETESPESARDRLEER